MRVCKALCVILLLSGCAPVQVTSSTFCTDYKPVYIDSVNDKLTDETAQAILTNNRFYKSHCH